ncbi:hypothetical protein [Longimicrobium sp.]|uniref:hypothetical protein n=1 Tax=Longimicrobium sp. TaxID=2029185 RepID=UPI002C1429F2|nr:hypothetical protein [Longimicrobium sp.]HSU14310.1 hypothetical protein [Longimicrobium sp.]
MADPVTSKAAKTPPLVVLSPTRHAALVAALDAAVAADPALAGARSLLLTPLTMLEALARDAVGALGDDVLAAERLRLLLALAATQMPALTAFRDVLGDSTPSSGISSSFPIPALAAAAIPCDDAVVHAGALVIVALAAGRVGKSTGLADPLLNNVLATALAAGPAEAVSRAIASGMGTDQVRALLAGLAAGHNGEDRRLSAVIATFLADACERARWACLETLFTQVRRDVAGSTWDAAGTGGIVEVDPRAACPGQPVSIRVEPVDDGPIIFLRTSATPETPLDAAHFLPLLEAKAASVVFAAQGRRSVARLADAVDAQTGVVTVTVPAGAHGGWVGFADPALLAETNDDRSALREQWDERNTGEPALRCAPVPIAAIPLLRNPPTPPRSPQARFDGGAPVILAASISPPVADPGGELRLKWRVQGATSVHVDPRPGVVEAEGEATVKAPEDRAHAEFVLVCESGCGDPLRRRLRARVRVRIRAIAADQPERTALALKLVGTPGKANVNVRLSSFAAAPARPLVAGEAFQLTATLSAADARGRAELRIGDEAKAMKLEGGKATITLPGRYAVDGLAGTVVFRAPDGEIDDRRDFGPLAFVTLRQRRLMVIRPGLATRDLHRVAAGEVARALDEARRTLAMEIDAAEPVWADDEELSLTEPADGPDVTATADLLERLHALAARTPGREDALWVAVVPKPPKSEFLRVEPAEAARAVAVCTPGALARLLDAELPAAEARVTRLRIAGTVDGASSIRLQPLRVEDRAAGPGARVESGLRAVALDAQGRVRASRAVRLLTADRPARLFVLLPITSDVTDLEIRIDDGQPPLPAMDPYGFGALCGDGSRDNPLALRRIHRSEGQPEVSGVETQGDGLAFEYGHTRSARSSIVVEAGGARGWGTVLRLQPCQEAGTLPVDRLRLRDDDRIRVAATDGWNTDFAPDVGLPIPRTPPFSVAARHAGGLRFWADVDEGGEPSIAWTLRELDGTGEVVGETAFEGTLVTVPRDFPGGDLTLTVVRGETAVSDTRTISRDGRVDCRRTELPEDAHA